MSVSPHDFQKVVYVADDDIDFNRLVLFALHKFGIKAFSFTTPDALMKAVSAHRPTLIILDINFSQALEGLETLREIRHQFGNDIAVMMASGLADSKIISQTISMGANDFVVKPLVRDVFISKLGRWVESDRLKDQTPNVRTLSPMSQPVIHLEVPYRIREIDEKGVTIETTAVVPKGTVLGLNSPLWDSMFSKKRTVLVSVSRTWQEAQPSTHAIQCTFDLADSELLRHVRNWLIQAQTEGAIDLVPPER